MGRLVTALGVLAVFAGVAATAPVPKGLKKNPPPRAKIEPLPGEKVFTVDFKDEPFGKVTEKLEKLTPLTYITKERPETKITLHAEKVCLAELFAQLDDLLYPQGWVVLRNKMSFSTLPVKDLAQYSLQFPLVNRNELERWSEHAPVRLSLDLDVKGVKAGTALAEDMQESGLRMREGKTGLYAVSGRATDVRKFVADMGGHIKKE